MWPFRAKAAAEGPPGKASVVGRRGEKLARGFLKRQGLKILATNYRCPAGEADLIALDRSTRAELGAETIAFVEVKTRRSDRHSEPESAVNAAKRRRMLRVASYYLNAHQTENLNARFDVLSVILREDDKPQIKYIPNAF